MHKVVQTPAFAQCPGCGVLLPMRDGPTHRYIDASPACWAMFSDLFNGGEPPMVATAATLLLGDAYAAQHPGTPSDQSIQSVAVHLMTLYGVRLRGVAPEHALWVRRRSLREGKRAKHGRFRWLTPPNLFGSPTIANIVHAATPTARGEQAEQYIDAIWTLWSQLHGPIITAWYDEYVVPD